MAAGYRRRCRLHLVERDVLRSQHGATLGCERSPENAGPTGAFRSVRHAKMEYHVSMMASDDDPKSRPIPSEDDEKFAPGAARSGDEADTSGAKRPWLSIGRRLIDGIPGLKVKRR